MTIINLTPHPVTIIRNCPDPNGQPDDRLEHRVTYPPCMPEDLPRAVEEQHTGIMETTETGDGQAWAGTTECLDATGLVDYLGYTGVTGLPEIPPDDLAYGCRTFRIVSITTALGALAAGRPVIDLLIPTGQVRDAQGRVCGATLLAAMARRLIDLGASRARMPDTAARPGSGVSAQVAP